MPPLPLDERIVVIQRPKSLALRVASPQTAATHQFSSHHSGPQHVPQPQPPPPRPYPPVSTSSSLECKRRSRSQKVRGERGPPSEGSSRTPSHCHSNGTVTLGPRPHKHTHTIDIKLSVDQGGGGASHSDSGRSTSLTRGKRVSLRFDTSQGDRRNGGSLGKGGVLQNHQNQNIKLEQRSHHQNHLLVSPGGVLEFVPAQRTQCNPRQEQEGDPYSTRSAGNSKLGPVHQTTHPHSLPRHHSSAPTPHAVLLKPHYPSSTSSSTQPPPSTARSTIPTQPPGPPRPPRSRDLQLHGLPLSPSASSRGGFPSPDHTCTIDLSRPFSCGCWRLIRCRGSRGHPAGCQGNGGGGGGGGSPSSSFSRGHGPANRSQAAGAMGLRTLGGCLSTASTATNTSSSTSTVSDCRAGLLRPLGCASCSRGSAGFESPAAFRKKLVGGCLPCTPLSSSAPLRALQSCVTGCNPKASQTGSSTCSYCSSDPIVVTYNPHRGKPPHAAARGFPSVGSNDDDDYSVRTIWPEELAKKMTRSKAQQNQQYHSGMGTSGGRPGHQQNGNSPVILDCRNLLEFTRSQVTDHAGRRRLQQGKMAVLDFIGSSTGNRDPGRDSLKRLWNKGGDVGMMVDGNRLDDDTGPHSPSPQSPPSFSPPPSAHGTLIKPKPRQREREGGHSLPSAQSLHLVLNSLNQEQDEENGRVHLSLPLSSSLPASLSEESVMTPDVENAVISPILPFLLLGNERDAQDLDLLLRLNISYVVNVTTHLPLYHLDTGLVRYKRLPATDNSKQNLRQYFEEVFEFIEEAHQCGRGVLVHCQAGVSRSATIVIAYLMKHTLMTMMDAYKYVRSRRPVVSPNLNFMGQLLEFERDLNSGVTPRILTPKLSGLETQV
ncbi:uncharacterized protein LOC114793068 [Denticeps clupeoides]|uniref:protein-tyrosine-phosphatase n=1 Tax=Denticeps clupeoides TaxID=299321 RepID=A0AAY3ZZJ7_9TELE|nr:uncharacterized protein LOC114793068 [Denticeps clupeoides]